MAPKLWQQLEKMFFSFCHSLGRMFSNMLWSACPVRRNDTKAMSIIAATARNNSPKIKSARSLLNMF